WAGRSQRAGASARVVWIAKRERRWTAVEQLRIGPVAGLRLCIILRRLVDCGATLAHEIRSMGKAREPSASRALLRSLAFCYAALRLILLSARDVSFLSAAFSSSRFFCSMDAQSLRPSCFAHAISVP